jgi:hypothetical protein
MIEYSSLLFVVDDIKFGLDVSFDNLQDRKGIPEEERMLV